MKTCIDSNIGQEIRLAVADLPLYNGGPGVDYTNAAVAYAVNITLLHDPDIRIDSVTGLAVPTSKTEALIVQRASGDGVHGSWSGVSGFIDIVDDPMRVKGSAFDPIAYTARKELIEECRIAPEEIQSLEIYLGERFTESRRNGGTLHVLPLLGINATAQKKPEIAVDTRELLAAEWVNLGELGCRTDLSDGYITNTLPNALGAFGLKAQYIHEILGLTDY